jgi:hypothetical protein
MGGCCSCCGGPSKLDVSLAGASAVNGVYVEDGTWNGKPCYTHESTGIEIWWDTDGWWMIGKTNDWYYMNKSDDNTPPMMGWEISDEYVNANASRPVPNITRKLT